MGCTFLTNINFLIDKLKKNATSVTQTVYDLRPQRSQTLTKEPNNRFSSGSRSTTEYVFLSHKKSDISIAK